MSIIKEYQMNSESPNCWHLNTYDASTSVAVAKVINEYDAACAAAEKVALGKIEKILANANPNANAVQVRSKVPVKSPKLIKRAKR